MSGIAKTNRLTTLRGSSANIAVGLARLGLGVGIIGSVGKDALADFLLGFLKNEGIDACFVRLAERYNTSLCLTEVSPPDHFPQVFYRRDPADVQLLYGLVRGRRPDECLRYGNAVAGIVVSRISCSDAVPYLKELLEFLVVAPPTVIQEIPVEAPRHKEGP